ncbi:flagellar biosynthesis anti-sigma factor FlgM [Fontivita pretiosa]|jgi:anti-sigma28 factor (negative regulator of flagellin synthesis)|uniref:flagellar biosynthesis anti-sigma factor FlgM n=1 Tax=Fontivita pretiosa TaxID=2989684 RepID=UPI003D175F04
MSSVHGIGSNSPVQKVITQPIHRQVPAASQQPRASDKLELSGMSHLLQALKSDRSVRAEKVAQIKAQIEAGTYETEEKLDIAADRLLDELFK